MCTSFIKKTEDNCLIGMNFDNNGMRYTVNTRKKDWFIVYIDTGKIKTPSFGIHRSGVFFNNLCVDSNGKGCYRRSTGITHTSKFLSEIIDGKIDVENLEVYLSQTEIVNVPDLSTHNMICTEQGNVWIIEPGRGNRYRELGDGEFQIMTNDPIFDVHEEDNISCGRYKKGKEVLNQNVTFDVSKAFELLSDMKQNGIDWITVFSLVFDKKANMVYYVENQDFTCIKEYVFPQNE
ncbi:hypothetical protein RZO55_10140 [Clostridium boliviensis]|uniref:Choloylglycine hydrolase n=1 Tax=Clostridium boliviensis TaxID=318465 RepID=A0ABU4GK00_9CLOT|nr:hypothetical protein [Clostridium boliviensis]MDW2797933.1 hypothetical protein [Clostridium boliviensis]